MIEKSENRGLLRRAGLAAATGLLALAGTAGTAFAQEEVAELSAGDTAWMITATALVLMMTVPGLALFTAAWCARRTSLQWPPRYSRSPP